MHLIIVGLALSPPSIVSINQKKMNSVLRTWDLEQLYYEKKTNNNIVSMIDWPIVKTHWKHNVCYATERNNCVTSMLQVYKICWTGDLLHLRASAGIVEHDELFLLREIMMKYPQIIRDPGFSADDRLQLLYRYFADEL